MDEVFLTLKGEHHYPWRAVDQDGNVLYILMQRWRDKKAAKKFFRKLLKGLAYAPRVIVTDKLKSYGAAKREILPEVEHRQHRSYKDKLLVTLRIMRQVSMLILTRSLGCLVFAWGCTFPTAVQITLPELLENPRAYAHQEVEVSGLVVGEVSRRRDFAYWHFHLRKDNVEIICYSEAYRISAWSTIDHVIRRAAAAGQEVTVGGYVVGWGAERSVFRLRWVRYENRTYDTEFIPPAAVIG